jgi:hypothetical protein
MNEGGEGGIQEVLRNTRKRNTFRGHNSRNRLSKSDPDASFMRMKDDHM